MGKSSRKNKKSSAAANVMTNAAVPVYGTRRFRYFVAGFVALLTFAAYLSCLHNDFVMWDDNRYVYENTHLHPLDAAFFKWAFLDFYRSNWHPLTWVSHALDYAAWGLNPLGHHLTNNILHALNTFFVVILVIKLLEAWRSSRQQDPSGADNPLLYPSQNVSYIIIAAMTGLLFGIHPLHVESVAWVSERKDLLCAMFFLLSTLAYTKYVSSGGGLRNRCYILVLFLFALALMSKPMAVSLPVVFLILDFHPFNRIRSIKTFLSAFLEKLPLIALSLASAVLTMLAQKAGGAIQSLEVIPLSSRALVAAESLLSYLWKMLWPLHLVPYYPYPKTIAFFSAEYLLSIILVCGITAACIIMAKKQKVWLAVWGYYVVTLLPVIGIVQVGDQAMADRYTYLPSLGPFILIGLFGAWLWKRSSPYGRAGAGMVIAIAILVLVSLSYLTLKQIAVWKDSLTLWTYVTEKEPEGAVAHYNLGIVYRHMNMRDKAVEQFLAAIRLWPNYADAHTNLGLTYQSLNMPGRAEEEFLIATGLKPDSVEAHSNLGILYQAFNLPDKAEAEFTTAVKMKPDSAEAHFNLGVFYQIRNMPDKSEEEFMSAVRLKPDFAEAHFRLGMVFYKRGQMEKARGELTRVLELKPDNQQALELLKIVEGRNKT
jgi:tetratricopeptide (TPR) repeat protein